jgi:hypothetical protein
MPDSMWGCRLNDLKFILVPFSFYWPGMTLAFTPQGRSFIVDVQMGLPGLIRFPRIAVICRIHFSLSPLHFYSYFSHALKFLP